MVWKRFLELVVTLSASETYAVFLAEYSRTPLTQINLDGEPSGYAENLDFFFLPPPQIGYIGSSKSGFYYLRYVPAYKGTAVA